MIDLEEPAQGPVHLYVGPQVTLDGPLGMTVPSSLCGAGGKAGRCTGWGTLTYPPCCQTQSVEVSGPLWNPWEPPALPKHRPASCSWPYSVRIVIWLMLTHPSNFFGGVQACFSSRSQENVICK